MKKALCFQCKQWSSNTDVCDACGYIINREVKKEIQRKEEAKLHPPTPPKKLEQAMNYLRNSRNPLLRILFYLLMSIWFIYVGIIMFIMYILSLVVG